MRDYNLDQMIDKEFERECQEDLERLLEHFEQIREHDAFMREQLGYKSYEKDARDMLGPECIFDYLSFMRELNQEIMEKECAQPSSSARDGDNEKTVETDRSDGERSNLEHADMDVGQSLFDLQTSRADDKEVQRPDRDDPDKSDLKYTPARNRDDIPTKLSALHTRESPELTMENDQTGENITRDLRDFQQDHDCHPDSEHDPEHDQRDKEAACLYTLTASAAAETRFAGHDREIDPGEYLFKSQTEAHQDMLERTEMEMPFPTYEDTTAAERPDESTTKRDDGGDRDQNEKEREKGDGDR